MAKKYSRSRSRSHSRKYKGGAGEEGADAAASQSSQGGSSAGDAAPVAPVPEINPQTVAAATKVAEGLLGKLMGASAQSQSGGRKSRKNCKGGNNNNNNNNQNGGSCDSCGPAQAQVAGATAGAIVGAVAGANAGGDIAAYEKASSIGSPLSGGSRKNKKRKGGNNNNNNNNQNGGMLPGLLSVVEGALVPFGLYLGQKALHKRYSSKKGSFSSSGKYYSGSFSKKNRK